MAFIRSFDIRKVDKLSTADKALYELLIADIAEGEVFPAVRKDELHFYHRGGCLYRIEGALLKRASSKKSAENYETKYNQNTKGTPYERAKTQNENKYMTEGGLETERQFLDRLNNHTFATGKKRTVVVLDIEVNLNGTIVKGKKCDLVLLNTDTNQIMFVEGKVFSDGRVNVEVGRTPEVIDQVRIYNDAIAEQQTEIVEQYGEHIRIINKLFGATYSEVVRLIDCKARLLVYETPRELNDNGRHVIETINRELGENNVAWFKQKDKPSIDEIWDALSVK